MVFYAKFKANLIEHIILKELALKLWQRFTLTLLVIFPVIANAADMYRGMATLLVGYPSIIFAITLILLALKDFGIILLKVITLPIAMLTIITNLLIFSTDTVSYFVYHMNHLNQADKFSNLPSESIISTDLIIMIIYLILNIFLIYLAIKFYKFKKVN